MRFGICLDAGLTDSQVAKVFEEQSDVKLVNLKSVLWERNQCTSVREDMQFTAD